jgi:hypothetical protein
MEAKPGDSANGIMHFRNSKVTRGSFRACDSASDAVTDC